MSARAVMVLGTSSGAGKSWLCTALCRYYARQGLRVLPFKAQNMSNNARVVASVANTAGQDAAGGRDVWGEVGSAQYFQALAARMRPDVRINPLLLKPEADTHSQVVFMGQYEPELTALPWHTRSERVWPRIAQLIDSLRDEADVLVIEGAGSPAEINLMSRDIVNLRVARQADARCVLVSDIDRGGAFAHLYGTWALLPEADRARVRGFVLNKFRGDAALLAPAPQMLQDLTQVPTVATLPMWRQHGLPEEDGVFDEGAWLNASAAAQAAATVAATAAESAFAHRRPAHAPRRVAIVAYPYISNLDEFQILRQVPGLELVWARSPQALLGSGEPAQAGASWVILPGSKHSSQDLAWLRQQGLDVALATHVQRGGAVLGICGGLQMLGRHLLAPHGVESPAQGLGLLPLQTLFAAHKTVHPQGLRLQGLRGPWAWLNNVDVAGYEIHHGQTQALADSEGGAALNPDVRVQSQALPPAPNSASSTKTGAVGEQQSVWQSANGQVLGLYTHGLFENTAVMQALLGQHAPSLDAVFDGLADFLDTHSEPGFWNRLIEP